jgi:hypothetical protein
MAWYPLGTPYRNSPRHCAGSVNAHAPPWSSVTIGTFLDGIPIEFIAAGGPFAAQMQDVEATAPACPCKRPVTLLQDP